MDRLQAYEHDLLKRAHRGDADAKRELEVRDLRHEADALTSALHDRARKGDKQALSELQRRAKGTQGTALAAAPAASSGPSWHDVASATQRERDRWTAVFASEHSKGRERAAARVLGKAEGWSAEVIISELAKARTDAQIEAGGSRASSDATWEKAYASTPSAKAQQVLAAQAKANGTSTNSGDTASRILAAQKKAGARSQRDINDDRWARAYAREGR